MPLRVRPVGSGLWETRVVPYGGICRTGRQKHAAGPPGEWTVHL